MNKMKTLSAVIGLGLAASFGMAHASPAPKLVGFNLAYQDTTGPDVHSYAWLEVSKLKGTNLSGLGMYPAATSFSQYVFAGHVFGVGAAGGASSVEVENPHKAASLTMHIRYGYKGKSFRGAKLPIKFDHDCKIKVTFPAGKGMASITRLSGSACQGVLNQPINANNVVHLHVNHGSRH